MNGLGLLLIKSKDITKNMGDWKTISKKDIYENAWIEVSHHEVINPSGNNGIYGVVHFHHKAIGIIAVDEQLNIVLVGQDRYPLNAYSWEIPEGGCPIGEDNLSAAKRELKEETGLEASQWEPLCKFHLSNSVTDEEGQLFLARNLKAGNSSPEETENLSVKRVTLEEALLLIDRGEITDAITIMGIYKLALMKSNGKL
jgi:8-oxo-dGTP pyrophosphatase MutT (NUDIX family)